MYGYLYMQLGPPQIVKKKAHVLPSLILWLYRYRLYSDSRLHVCFMKDRQDLLDLAIAVRDFAP